MRPSKPELEQIRDIGLRLLAGREHSRYELFNKLQAKGFERNRIQQVIDELTEQGWQSDLRFAESLCRLRINNGYGPLRIAYELRQHGVDNYSVERLIGETAGSWMNLMERVYRSKFTEVQAMSRKEWAKRARFLQQRGFTFEMIQSLFTQLRIKL